jgi:DNA-binding CsgD family transcriptional regulator/tetratricopeptide (TPR) repeat protein
VISTGLCPARWQAYRCGVTVVRAPSFIGRAYERRSLDGLLDRVRGGESAALVIRGEAGIGKSALLQYCAHQASDCRVAQIAGIESEFEMPFAAVHQMCAPMLDALSALPEPQQQALQVAFGLAAGSAPDRFVVGLAVLGLLAEVATERPLVCLVDDAQWLDEPSRQVLGFVGRRQMAEAVLLLLAVRETGDEQLFTLPALTLDGLGEDDARALITAVVAGHLDEQIRDRIVAETRGNPLRLLELPHEMSTAELAGGFGMPFTGPVAGPIEEHYARRVNALPESTRRLLLLAAADPTGDATLLWRAAQTLGVARDAAAAAESEQLLEIGSQVRFRHPLVRSTVYAAATPGDRAAAHSALAAATDAAVDPARRVWHLAAATTGPDEAVASQLQQMGAAAQARAGAAGAAAFLERSVQLTAEPERRAERALAAAHAHMHAGAFEAARALLAEAQAVATGDVQRARIERLRGQIQFASNPGPEAPALLLDVAKTLEPLDVSLARETYRDAWIASYVAGARARPGGRLSEVSEAVLAAVPARDGAPAWDLLLDGFARVVTDGLAAGAPNVRRAADAFLRAEIPDDEFVQWGHLVTMAPHALWDWESWDRLNTKHVELARTSGALAPLSIALNGRGMFAAWWGDFDAATALNAEFNAISEAMGSGWYSVGVLLHAAYQGRPEALELMAVSEADSIERGAGHGLHIATWTRAILCNGLGRYADALAAAERAAYEMELPNGTGSALPEVIEAAVRSRRPDVARDAMELLPKHTLDDSDWAVGIEARSRALVSKGEEAEHWYVEAVQRLARTTIRTELARAHLLYGEWLRREGRRVDARRQLASAYDMFSAMGAEAFAERARRELVATGKKVRKQDFATRDELTPQEEHIARLARDGRSNAEIATELFLSVRTVEWHLRKVFMKLDVRSRKDLKEALPSRGQNPAVTT